MAPQIEFSVQLTEKDVACACDEFSFRWRKCLVPGIAVSVAGIVGLFLEPEWPGVASAVITVGLLLIYFGTLVPIILRRAGVRQFRRNPAAQEKMHYEVFDDHLIVTSELARSELRWKAFLKTKETTGYLCLYLSPQLAYIIPLAILAPSEASQFRELVRSRVLQG